MIYGNAASTGYYAISSYSKSDLNDCALVVLNSCYSGMTDPQNSENNLLTKCTQRGVNTAIGFTGVLRIGLSKQWSDKFWSGLLYGKTVNVAATDATYAVGSTGGYNTKLVLGNGNLIIKPFKGGVL